MRIEVADIGEYFLYQISQRGKISPFENMLREDAKPDLNRVKPGAVLGRIDKTDPMFFRIIQDR